MSLMEEYYELNEAEEVSSIWKIMQIIFYISAACLGLWCGYTLALLRLKFEDKCYLFTSVKLLSSKESKIDNGNINWGADSLCDYCQYSMVSSFIVATIWATFFLMCGKGGKSLTGLPQPWRIVWPSLIFNFIYFIIALVTAINIQKGTDRFCFFHDFDKRIKTKSMKDNCELLKFVLKKNLYVTSLQLQIVSKTCWGCTISWLILSLISFFRIIFVIDFHMYKVCVFKIGDTGQNKKEEVLRITNYEEPKKIQLREENNKRVNYIDDKLNLEEEKRRKYKIDKFPIRQYFNPVNKPLIKYDATYKVAGDIRMLKRGKKNKSISKSFDRTFEKNKSNLPRAIRKKNTTVTLQTKIPDKSDSPEHPSFLDSYKICNEYIKVYENEDDKFPNQKNCDRNENDRKAECEHFSGDFSPNCYIRLKKLV